MKRVLIAVLLCLAQPLRAQDAAEDAKKAAVLEEARQHVAKAKVHFDLGEYKEAADEYIIVYRLRPIPALLFNIAQAYRQGGIYDKARQFYKSYLREAPDLKNRAMIEQNIREMDDLLAKEKRAKEAAPNGVKEPPEASLPLPEKTAAKSPAHQKPAEVAQKPPELPQPAPTPVAPATQKTQEPPKLAMATPPRPSAPVAATSTAVQPVAEEGQPLYKKWWLWTAVGVVAVGAGVAAMTMGGNAPPASHFGTTPVFP
jgi:tetratricopeptide (TPR) repeat protein